MNTAFMRALVFPLATVSSYLIDRSPYLTVFYSFLGPLCAWIEKRDGKNWCATVVFAIRLKRKKEARKEVSSCNTKQKEQGRKI